MSFFKKTLSLLASIYLLLCTSIFYVGCKTETTPDEPKEYLPVSDLTVTAKYKQAVLTWTNPDDNELSSIEIKYGTNANKPSEKKVCNKSETTCTISDLENGTKYYFTVYAIYSDANNTRKSSATKTIETPKPEAVKNLKAESTGTDSIKLTWVNQTEDFYKSNKILYGTDSNKLDKTIKIESFKTAATEVKELSPETKYYFQVVTILSDDETVTSAKVNATTDKEVAPETENPPSENNPSNEDDNGDEDSNSNNNENSNPSGNENNNPGNQEDPEPENPPSENNPSNEDDNDQTNKDDLVNISSVDFAKKLTIGWNLGNTLDAPTETGWGMPTTTKEMIDTVAAAGFKTIRIPVSWNTHVSGADYTINTTWMNRVKEIVDWAISDDMYVILNIHHDNYFAGASFIKNENNIKGLADSDVFGFALALDDTEGLQTKSKNYLSKVWTQIATKFANYDNHLIFEVLNEPRAYGTDLEWWISDTATAKKYCDVITDYEKTCISAIRSVTGNENRFLMVPGYAASGSNQTFLNAYTMPNNDTAEDKLLLSAHAYDPGDFAMGGEDYTYEANDEGAALTSIFNYLKTNYTNKGVGVVMGEASCTNKDNLSERLKWFEAYHAKAKDAGIPVVLWDNMVATPDGTLSDNKREDTNGEHHGYLNRKKCAWYFPTLIQKAMDTVGVTGYSIPEYVAPTLSSIGWNESKASQISNNTWSLDWTSNNNIPANTKAKAGSILKIVLAQANFTFRMVNSDWSYNYTEGTIINGSAGGSDISTSSTEVYYVLTSEDAAKYKTDNILFVGNPGNTITAVYFQE